jgi:hypothetical protein
VNYRVGTNIGSATPGQDYLATSGSVVIPAGQTQAIVPVTVYGDTTYEGQESLYVELTSVTNAQIVQDQAEGFRNSWRVIYINNDDALSPGASVSAAAAVASSYGAQQLSSEPLTGQAGVTA